MPFGGPVSVQAFATGSRTAQARPCRLAKRGRVLYHTLRPHDLNLFAVVPWDTSLHATPEATSAAARYVSQRPSLRWFLSTWSPLYSTSAAPAQVLHTCAAGQRAFSASAESRFARHRVHHTARGLEHIIRVCTFMAITNATPHLQAGDASTTTVCTQR